MEIYVGYGCSIGCEVSRLEMENTWYSCLSDKRKDGINVVFEDRVGTKYFHTLVSLLVNYKY